MIRNRVRDDYNDRDILNTLDELSLWAAPFGLKLMENIEYRKNVKALDIGCGLGFPSIELAQRLGDSSKVYGLDIWEAALEQARYKAAVYNVANVEFVHGDANSMPFGDGEFDLVVSNNGINNTGDEARAISESYRVLKAGGRLVFTVNLPGTMKEFYCAYRETLYEMKLDRYVPGIEEHIHKRRKPLKYLERNIATVGFGIEDIDEGSFNMRFCDGSAMFNHHLIRVCFLKPWVDIIGEESIETAVFTALEKKLNEIAQKQRGLKLSIPFACFNCVKPQ